MRTDEERDQRRLAMSTAVRHQSVPGDMAVFEAILELCRTVDDFREQTDASLALLQNELAGICEEIDGLAKKVDDLKSFR